MTKRITSLILVTLLVVSLFAFVGCSNTDEMQQKIEDLQQVLQTQTEILTELQNTNASNIAQIANLTEEIAKLQDQIDTMEKMGIEWFEVYCLCELYSDYGEGEVLSTNDLDTISDLYYNNKPLPLSQLDVDVIKKIKITFLGNMNLSIEEFDELYIDEYYGSYKTTTGKDCYAVILGLHTDGLGTACCDVRIYVANYTI